MKMDKKQGKDKTLDKSQKILDIYWIDSEKKY